MAVNSGLAVGRFAAFGYLEGELIPNENVGELT